MPLVEWWAFPEYCLSSRDMKSISCICVKPLAALVKSQMGAGSRYESMACWGCSVVEGCGDGACVGLDGEQMEGGDENEDNDLDRWVGDDGECGGC